MSLSLPVSLSAPTLSGPTATHANVLPGVNLVVTAAAQGGFSDMPIVENATAAANPALSLLLTAAVTTTAGLTPDVDAASNFARPELRRAPGVDRTCTHRLGRV